MAYGSPKGRRHRAKGWRKRKRPGFSGLGARRHHAGANFDVHVTIERDVGASTAREFLAAACVKKHGRARRRNYIVHRCGSGSGRSPTAAAKKALVSLGRGLKRRA